MKKIGLKILIPLFYFISINKLFSILNSKQSEIIRSGLIAISTDPPQVTDWIYRDTFLFLFAYAICAILVVLILALSKKYFILIGNDTWQTTIFYFLLTASIVIYKIPYGYYSENKKYGFAILFLLLSLSTAFFWNYIVTTIPKIKPVFIRYYDFIIYFLVGFSTVQRLIAFYLDPNLLYRDDDPFIYYDQALKIFENNTTPPSDISQGMIYFLAFCFKIFGVGQIVPKLILIVIGAIGMFCAIKLAYEVSKSQLISLIVGIFYLTSSHYVSFSNFFWNENLFHPLFSIILYINHRALSKKESFAIVVQVIVCITFSFYLSLLRSWFPFVFSLFILSYISKSNNRTQNLHIFSILLLFVFSYIVSKMILLGWSGSVFVTSNSHINLIIGNNPYSQGTYTRHWKTFADANGVDANGNEIFSHLYEYYLNNPIAFIYNFVKKFFLWFVGTGGPRMFTDYYQHPLSIAQYFYRITVSIFVITGLLRVYTLKIYNILIVYLAIFGIHMIYFVDYRFTLTSMQLQAILFSFGLVHFLNRIKEFNFFAPNKETQ